MMYTKTFHTFRLFLFCFFFTVFLPHVSSAETTVKLKAGYVKDGDLWIKQGTEDRRITNTKGISRPSWSSDGSKLAYMKDEKDLWLYDVAYDSHFFIASDVHNVRWAPKLNVLAFQIQSVLNVKDVRLERPGPILNAAFGVGNYAWLPNGDGFLVSSQAHLLPNGWTNIHLFHVLLDKDLTTKKVQRFITIPKTVTFDNAEVMAIGTSTFKWSKHGKWIAFILHPTASLSADGNMLCTVSYDGKAFKPLGEMLNYERWFKWSPFTHSLASIQGSGREATINKSLVVQRPPSSSPNRFTPPGEVDVDMTWIAMNDIVVSRIKAHGEQPSLYRNNNKKQQLRITQPPNGFGDYAPDYHTRAKALTWIRSNGQSAAAMRADSSGNNPIAWIPKIDVASDYYGFADWSEVIDIMFSTEE